MHILLLLNLLLVCPSAGCPNLCICKWKNGKEWVECASRELRDLPHGAREETQVFDLSGNHLFSLPANCFYILRLFNLQKLYLRHSHIRHVASKAFSGLQGLVELDLSVNELEQVPSDSFISVGNLMRLNLSGNPLRILNRNAFIHLSQLSFLDLSHCQLSLLELRAFAGLHALEWLRLNNNLLSDVPNTVLPMSTSLRGLTMHGNPWHCNCHLRPLQNWLKATQNQILQDINLNCAEPPRLKAKAVLTLKTQDLACIPNIKLANQLNVYESENITINCEVEAIPPPVIIWLLNGEFLNIEHSIIKNEMIRYACSEYVIDGKIISSLSILEVHKSDEGNYVCQAENAAGISWSNLSMRVLFNERNTINLSVENLKSGYVTAIAVGALLGTLLAFGCLFLSLFLYARQLRSYSKKNLEQPSSPKSVILQSTLKTNSCESLSKVHMLNDFFYSMSYSVENSILLGKSDTHEQMSIAYNQSQYLPKKIFSKPDLINALKIKNNHVLSSYKHTNQSYSEPFSSYLDSDGYPLNFGLPKLDLNITHLKEGAHKTFSHNKHYQSILLNESTTCHVVPVSLELEFIKPENYIIHPLFGIDYVDTTSIPVSSRINVMNISKKVIVNSLSEKKMLLESKNVKNLSRTESKNTLKQNIIDSSESFEILEHPESPDEG